VSFRITLSDIEWLSKIFNDKKLRAVSAIAKLLVLYAQGGTIDIRSGGVSFEFATGGHVMEQRRRQLRPYWTNRCMNFSADTLRLLNIILQSVNSTRLSTRVYTLKDLAIGLRESCQLCRIMRLWPTHRDIWHPPCCVRSRLDCRTACVDCFYAPQHT